MNLSSLKPHKKLITKQIWILATITFFIFLLALILQLLIPLGGKASLAKVGSIVYPAALGLSILMWLISLPISILWVKNLQYFVEEERIRIHYGILSKVQQNIPFKAITDFILHRSLFDRILGIGSVRIQTAGQSATATGYEGNMAGLIEWEDIYNELRKLLIKKRSTMGMMGVDEPDTEEELLREILSELKEIKEHLKK